MKLRDWTGMIIRARPKYLDNIDFHNIDDSRISDNNHFYFNSGRAALKFYLNYLSSKKNGKIKIAMQAFNCNVVLDAALEANCEIYLLDIKLDDFSISLHSLQRLLLREKLDVLLLTHYQGIPNIEYESIVSLCKKNDIVILEDLAQAYDSVVDGVKVGTLGNVNLFSFAFDKPLSCLQGGMLQINDEVDVKIIEAYEKLKHESSKNAEMDIRILEFLHQYTTPDYYVSSVENLNLVRLLMSLQFSNKMTYRLLNVQVLVVIYNILRKLKVRIKNKKSIIEIQQLNNKKISLINEQAKKYKYNAKEVNYIKKICVKLSIPFIDNKNSIIHWNRFSVIDKDNKLENYLIERGYQVGNYNWPLTLDRLYSKNQHVHVVEDLESAYFTSKHILNIPVWSLHDK